MPAAVNDMPIPASTDPSVDALPTASLRTRLLSMVYESMLLFGVLFIATWLFSTLLQQRHALYLRDNLQFWLFVVLGIYFCWFWRHGGQTLAMKTWRIRLLTREGETLPWTRTLARYVLAWMWFVPGLVAAHALNARGWMLVMFPVLNLFLWALAVFLNRDRQFPHDWLAGTRIVRMPGIQPLAKASDTS